MHHLTMHRPEDQSVDLTEEYELSFHEPAADSRRVSAARYWENVKKHKIVENDTFVSSFVLPFGLQVILVLLLYGHSVLSQDLFETGAGTMLGIYPSMVNLAAHARITTNATCGENGPEYFCKLVEHVQRISRRKRSQCDVCSTASASPRQRHDIEFAIDGRGDRWWQSPSIDNGYRYHWVTITLDLKQVFQVAYFILKAANAPRPGNWILEKSLDGVTWQPWQYFAVSDHECRKLYSARVTGTGSPRLRYDNEAVCTSYFSQLLPLQNGEIHISLINGRPTAGNPSEQLIEFTSARYVRLRLQKIRTLLADLMTIAKRPAEQLDPSVTRRYFYSVKDISIGGMCICYGHAHDCPTSPTNEKFVCKCEHHTTGDNCERCMPKFNQQKWSPGNEGFQCEECNCHGHAASCYYDENVERRRESLNLDGIRKGGGVCINCHDYTAGINCDSCIDGYFRPLNVLPTDPRPCRPCECGAFGTRTTFDGNRMCRKSVDDGGAHRGMLPGDCYCKEGYAGPKCDQCDFGFRGYPHCKPCRCNVAGSLNVDPCRGECVCKENVVGVHCDQCRSGYFNLDRDSDAGCEKCYCSGVTEVCDSAVLYRDALRSLRGWTVVDRAGAYTRNPLYHKEQGEPYVSHEETARALCTGLYFWKPPEEFFGKKLSSYGGALRYTIYYELPMIGAQSPIKDVDVIIEGSGIALEYNRQKDVLPYISTPFVVPFEEGAGWLEANTQTPANKTQIFQALTDLRRILIRASYNRNGNSVFRIRDVSMDIATPDGVGEPLSSVEQCRCPVGYKGSSCEDCASGFYRRGKACVECQCYGHSTTCNLYTGVCESCHNGTTGIHCELCLPGFYGDATSTGCRKCACPLTNTSNNFSPTCILDELDNVMICQKCLIGYQGLQCESCAEGYFGDPTVLGEVCRPCQCNGNSQICDKSTGQCVECQGNSAGPRCNRCATGYYGDAVVRKDCQACSCDFYGSNSSRCDSITGQCACRDGVTGRQCNACSDEEFLDRVSRRCVPCFCHSHGSVGSGCDVTGHCICKQGVVGKKCDLCAKGYFNFGQDGCSKCNCPQTSGHCDPITGACVCPPYTTGARCSQCMPYAFGWDANSGCQLCNCHIDGSKSPLCDVLNGECECKDEYTGKKCSECRDGFYDFPNCLPCLCHIQGTESFSCHEDDEMCSCSSVGQCFCKENVVGVKCNRCTEGTFSLQHDNPIGCTECFCFGVADQCEQAEYYWGSTVSLTVGSQVSVSNQINTRSTTEGILMSKSAETVTMDPATVRRTMQYEPYYWRLPPQFNGDKLSSYGGRLRFTLYYAAEIGESTHADAATVLIRGRHNATTISYKLEDPPNRKSTPYVVIMRESGWRYLDTDIPVKRQDFMMVLHDVKFFLIKASYGEMMGQSRLQDVFMDVAAEGVGGRGDSSSNNPLALGVEACECPPGYTGLSCQHCDTGYVRIRSGRYLGECRPCACNGRSDVCDVKSGECIACRGNFEGDHCERCKPGFYFTIGPTGAMCRKCACPLPAPSNNFSPTCHSTNFGGYICDRCPVGYEAPHCERCSMGYYGNPNEPGGFCRKCGCNTVGSVSTGCDEVTGKCFCAPGITGRVCDRCRPGHAISEDGCIKCDDECSAKLLEKVEALIHTTEAVDFGNIFPPPWDRLLRKENKTNMLEPYLKILVHRKRNFEAARCLRIQASLDRKMAHVMDVLMTIINVTSKVRNENISIQVHVEKSKMCDTTAEDLLYRVNQSRERLEKRMAKITGVVTDSQNLAHRIQRLLERLQEGTEIDDSEIVGRIAVLITQLRNRSITKYRDIANEELRLANELTTRVTKKFAQATLDLMKLRNRTRTEISHQTAEVLQKMNDLIRNAWGADALEKEARRLNDLNRITIRQLIADFEKLQNEIAMVDTVMKDAVDNVNHTENKALMVREYIEKIQMQGKKLGELLGELQTESDKITSAQAKLNSLGALVRQAKEHERELVNLSNYFVNAYNNVSGVSFKETDAATRYSRIANSIEKANETVKRALHLSMDAIKSDKGDMENHVNLALKNSVDLLNDVKEMKEETKAKRRKIGNMRNQTKNSNTTIKDLVKRTKKIQKHIVEINNELTPSVENARKVSKDAKDVVNHITIKTNDLKKDVVESEKAVEVATKYDEIINEIKTNQFWVKSVPAMLNLASVTTDEANVKQARVEMRSQEVRRKIGDLQNQIKEARMKAASVRKASVKSEGTCVMRYLPKIKPGRVTEVVLEVMTEKADNLLFYLGRSEGDFLSVETVGGRVRVTWDLGSGFAQVENDVSVIKDEKVDVDWYHIEVSRLDQHLNLTVHRKANVSGMVSSVTGSSPDDSIILDVDERDLLYVGGIAEYVKLQKEIPVRSFTGCMGEAYLQGKHVGLWNFREVSDPSHCDGCVANLEYKIQAPRVVFGFGGDGYSLLQYLPGRPPETRLSVIDLEFKTLSSTGLLLYMGSTLTNDFVSVELVDGNVVARVDVGSGIHVIRTQRRYNTGQWVGVYFRRLFGKVRLTMKHPDMQNEMNDILINGTELHFNITSDDLICVGGCPNDIVFSDPVQRTGFIGCMRNFKIFNTAQPLVGSGNVLRFAQVDTACPEKIQRDIGIDEGGFVELPGHTLPVTGSVSITFSSREPDALLLLATDGGIATKRKRRRRQSTKNFYSLSLSGGHIEARLRASSGFPLILKSRLSLYSDGDEHTALLRRNGNLITLIVDDNMDGIISGTLPRGGKADLSASRLFVGGLPGSIRITDMAATNGSINGCVRELVTDRLVDFKNATDVAKSYVGSCAYTPTFPMILPRPSVVTTTEKTQPHIRSTTPSVTPSALITVTASPTVNQVRTTDATGCATEGDAPVLKGFNVRFGHSAHSHLEIAFKDDIETKFRVQVEFRTLASHGLILYTASDEYSDFFSLQLKNGKPVFLFDSGKGPGEAAGNISLNDGEWHTVRISRSKRKGYIKVDDMRYDMAKSPVGANRMDVTKILYVGGVPTGLDVHRLSGMWQSLDSCVRSVTLNKGKLDLRNPDMSHDVGSCYQHTEEGAYFDGQGYAVYKNDYRVGPVMAIELEFRTWARDGALVTISDKTRSDGLALELVNGSIFFRVNNGAGDIVTQYTPKFDQLKYALCDGKWHKVKASKSKYQLTLTVDGQFRTDPGTSTGDQNSADTKESLYIGGYPDYAIPQKQLVTKEKFKGCMRRMKLKGQTVEFSRVQEYQDVQPNSCPKANGS